MNSSLYFELRQPTIVEQGKTYPALFLMHGMGSNEQDLLTLVKGLEEKFYIFSIRGPLSQPPGYAFFTIEGFGKPHREVFDHTINQVRDFINEVCEKHPIDRSSIFLLGFSQGAILSMSLAFILGNRIKGIVALSGYLPQFVREEYEKQPINDLSIFLSHGTMDPVLPFEWSGSAYAFFQEQGANVEFHSYPVGHTVSMDNYNDFRKWLDKQIEKEN